MSDAPTLPPASSEDLAERFNGTLDGFNSAMGLRFVRVTADEVVAEIVVGPEHLQPYGIVHGGVYCGIVETVCSVGAAVFAMRQGQAVVGLENHTSFLKAVRSGTIRFTAVPLARGRSTQVWQATAVDDQGNTAASGSVRLFALEAGAQIGGGQARVDAHPGE